MVLNKIKPPHISISPRTQIFVQLMDIILHGHTFNPGCPTALCWAERGNVAPQ